MRSPTIVFAGYCAFFTCVFAPVLFSGKFMTSGDGVTQGIPTYFGRTPLVEPGLMLGYPLFADPNQAFWYPVLRIARAIPGAFNVFALVPYVVAAFGTYGFAKRVSGSQIGALAAGVTVSLGGFMIAHQGHLMIVHPACWAPVALWAIAELRERSSGFAVAGGAVAIALGATAGTQQPVVYLLFVGCAYAVVFRPVERARCVAFFRDVLVLLVVGLALAAIALVPEVEFALRTDRAHQSIADFSVFSTGPVEFALRALFPYAFGGNTLPQFAQTYPPLGAYTETTNYAGILTLSLAIVALLDRMVRRRALFWFGVTAWAAWMAAGQTLGAAWLARAIPIYDAYRIPGRHAFEFVFAVGILASLGVAAMESGRVPRRNVAIALGSVGAAFAIALGAFALFGHDILAAVAQTVDVSTIPITVGGNAALAIPVCVFAFSCIVVLSCTWLPKRFVARVALVGITCDMLVFAYGSYWFSASAPLTVVNAPIGVKHLRSSLQGERARYLDLGGETTHSIPANLATLWGLPNATGYVSLEDRSFESLLHASPTGVVTIPDAAQGNASALDLTGIRFLLLPPDPPATVPIASALLGVSLDGFIGDRTIAGQRSVAYDLSVAHAGDALEIVTALGNSIAIPNRAHVADVLVRNAKRVMRFPILAGVDTSESAYDRPDVRALVKHARANIFSGSRDAHLYISTLTLPANTPVESVSIAWVYRGPASAALTVAHVALIDRARGLAYPFYADGGFSRTDRHFVPRGDVYRDGGEQVVENMRAFPHAWIADRYVVATPDEQLESVRSGESNGSALDLRRTVLLSEPAPAVARNANGRVIVRSSEPTVETDDVTCTSDCVLVTNDLWYPGWTATIDGRSARVVPVDFALRGVVVPSGVHRVALWFAPWSLRVGIAISLAAALFMLAVLLALRER